MDKLKFWVFLCLSWSEKKSIGGGFYFFGNLNSNISNFGGGIIVPLFSKQ